MGLRKFLNPLLEPFGYQLFRSSPKALGLSPFRDMQRLTVSQQPVIFDIGANRGQTIHELRRHFREPTIHAFDPCTTVFQDLQRNCGNLPGVRLNNLGVGSEIGVREFHEFESTDMSSFLQPGEDCWSHVTGRQPVQLTTFDQYCIDHSIPFVDILKSDTQGYDFEVLQGASQMLQERRVHLIFLEIVFSKMYKDLPRLDQVYGFLAERGYELVAFYRMYFQYDRACWTDALFVHPGFRADRCQALTKSLTTKGSASSEAHLDPRRTERRAG